MSPPPDVDGAARALAAAGDDPPALRAWLETWAGDEHVLLAVLLRPVPRRLLEMLGSVPPWCERVLIAGAVARHVRTPPPVALRLLGNLLWRDLAQVAANPCLSGLVRVRAEALLVERLIELRLGDKIALARLATPPVLRALLAESDGRILDAALANPRLGEEALVAVLRSPQVPRPLLEHAAAAPRWSASYAVRRELVLQPRTPLPLALAQITSLVRRDLLRVARDANLAPLVRAAAERAAHGNPSGPWTLS